MKKQGVTKEDVGFGLVIGIPNFCSALFLLLSLADIPAMIAYPTYSVAAIVMVTLVGVIFFKEKLSRRQILSMFMIFAALGAAEYLKVSLTKEDEFMFFSSVHADDDLKRYPAAIQKAIEYAKNTDFSALEDGRQEIDGDKMYANLFHLTSKQKEEAHPELHKKYVDVQYWICGEELCGVAPYQRRGQVHRDARG